MSSWRSLQVCDIAVDAAVYKNDVSRLLRRGTWIAAAKDFLKEAVDITYTDRESRSDLRETLKSGSFVFLKSVVEVRDLRTRSEVGNGKSVFEIEGVEEGDVEFSGRSLRCRC